ncbi:MAG: hypothetical protein ABIO71_10020 [Caldimonas sp.]
MSESIFSAALTFALLAGGTVAIGSEMLGSHRPPKQAVASVTLPAVTVVGRRPAPVAVALETTASAPQRIQ